MAVTFIRRGGKFLMNGGKFVINNESCCCDQPPPGLCDSHPATLYVHVTCDGNTSTFAIAEQSPGGYVGRYWMGSGSISDTGTMIVSVCCEGTTGGIKVNYDACTGILNDCRESAQPPDGYEFPITRTVSPPPGGCGCGSSLSFTIDGTP